MPISLPTPLHLLPLLLFFLVTAMELRSKNNSPFDCLLFDLDDTLYPFSTGISEACKKNIDEFLSLKCGVPAEEASLLRVKLFRTHGSSLAGLIALGYDVHPDEYHSFVHGLLPYENIRPDLQLRELLLSIPQTKIVIFRPSSRPLSSISLHVLIIYSFFLNFFQIFTNSDRKHASRVLERLGVEEECFHRIICFETMNPGLFQPNPAHSALRPTPSVVLKPFAAAVKAAIFISGFDPYRTLFLDDSERNIVAGKAEGLHTAVVGRKTTTEAADYAVEGMSSLRNDIPEIWGVAAAEGSGGVRGEHSGFVVSCELDAIRPTVAPIEA